MTTTEKRWSERQTNAGQLNLYALLIVCGNYVYNNCTNLIEVSWNVKISSSVNRKLLQLVERLITTFICSLNSSNRRAWLLSRCRPAEFQNKMQNFGTNYLLPVSNLAFLWIRHPYIWNSPDIYWTCPTAQEVMSGRFGVMLEAPDQA